MTKRPPLLLRAKSGIADSELSPVSDSVGRVRQVSSIVTDPNDPVQGGSGYVATGSTFHKYGQFEKNETHCAVSGI